jgi:hypothetical protein
MGSVARFARGEPVAMSPDAEYTIREATLADIPLLFEVRHNM